MGKQNSTRKRNGETSRQYVERSLREQEYMKLRHAAIRKALERPPLPKRRMTPKERKKADRQQDRNDFLEFISKEKIKEEGGMPPSP